MAEISEAALKEIQEAFELYKGLLRETKLAPSTLNTYIPHAERFVDWLAGKVEITEMGTRRRRS